MEDESNVVWKREGRADIVLAETAEYLKYKSNPHTLKKVCTFLREDFLKFEKMLREDILRKKSGK